MIMHKQSDRGTSFYFFLCEVYMQTFEKNHSDKTLKLGREKKNKKVLSKTSDTDFKR